MKVLVIDNGSENTDKLEDLLDGHRVEVESWEGFGVRDAEMADLVVLTGGYPEPVVENRRQFVRERTLIKERAKPIVGICWGAELIADVYRAEMAYLDEKARGFVELQFAKEVTLFEGLDEEHFRVYESRRWVIESVPTILRELAWSEMGVEMFAHRFKPTYGFMFHPELYVDGQVGDEIFLRLMEVLAEDG